MSRKFPREVILEYIQTYISSDWEEVENDRGSWININSIFYHDKKRRLGINIDENYTNDYKAGSMSFIKFVSESKGISEQEAERLLLKLHLKNLKNGFTSIKKKDHSLDNQPIDLDEIMDYTPWIEINDKCLRDKLGRKAISYLTHRGFNKNDIIKYKLKYVNQETCWICQGKGHFNDEECVNCKGSGNNYYYGRIIVPTYENKKLVYFQGRDFLDRGDFRYMNPRIGKKQVVFFLDNIQENQPVYVCEGPFDSMTLRDVSATCLLGSTLSDPQAMKIIHKRPSEIIFVPDNDEKEETRNMIIKNMIKNIKKIKRLSDGKIKIGVYKWYKLSNKKDINSASITYVDKNLVSYPYETIEGKVMMSHE